MIISKRTKRKTISVICMVSMIMFILPSMLFSSAESAVYRSPYDTAFSADGSMLAVSDVTAGQLVFINPSTGTVTRSVTLNGEPKGLAWDGNTRVYAAEYGAGTVAEIDPSSGSILRRFTVGGTPSGLAYVSSGSRLLVTDKGLCKLYVVDVANGNVTAQVPVVNAPESVDVTSDGTVAVVANTLPNGDARNVTYGADVSFIDLSANTLLSNVRLPQGSTNVKGLKISRDGTKVFVTHMLGRVNVPTTQITRGWSVTNALSIIDLSTRTLYATLLLDGINQGAADPWDLVQSSDGSTLWVSISGTHEVAKINLTGVWSNMPTDAASRTALKDNLTFLRGNGLLTTIKLPGQGPRGIDLSSGKLAVSAYYAGKVYLIEPSAGVITNEVAVGTISAEDTVRKGDRIYHDATYSVQGWTSCSTCHPDARSDGLNWDMPNDGIGTPKNSKSHLYSPYTPPSMATGIRANADIAINAGFNYISFLQPTQADKDAVSAYLQALTPEKSPYLTSDGYLTADADAGKDLFNSSAVGCADCHSGTYTTDMQLYNVGTGHPLDRWDTFDTPTLSELWLTAPYLHDGCAPTLMDVLTTFNAGDTHGHTSQLTETQLQQLVAYMQQIDGIDPTP